MALSGSVIASFSLSPVWLALVCAIGLGLGHVASRIRLSLLWLLLPLVCYANVVLRLPSAANGARSSVGAFVCFEGKVIECQKETPAQKVLVQPQSDAVFAGNCCLVEMRKKPLPDIQPGDVLAVQGRLDLPRHAFYPWQFDYSQYLRYRGVAYICRAVSVKVIQRGALFSLLKSLEGARAKLIAIHEKIMGPEMTQLLVSIVLGDRAVSIAQETQDTFREVGLSHVLAASGFNLSIVVLTARWIMGLAVKNQLWLNLLTVPWIVSYDLMAGLSPSILRASFMILLALCAGVVLRKANGIAVLAACTIISLLIYPGCLQDVGFQLSYLATFGIISAAKELQNMLYASARQITVSKWLSEVLSVVLLAQASVLPVQLSYFWRFSFLFLPANLAVDPVLPPITVLGFISCLMALPSKANDSWFLLCSWLDRICCLMLKVILAVVNYLAGHGQGFNFGPPAAVLVAVYFICLTLFVLSLKTRKYLCTAALLLLISTMCLLFVRQNRPKLIIANLHSSVIVLKPGADYMILGNDANDRETNALIRFFGGKQTNNSFALHHLLAGVDTLLCNERENVLLIDLAKLVRLQFVPQDTYQCVVIYNSSTKNVTHKDRTKLTLLLAQLHLSNTQIVLPKTHRNVVALTRNGFSDNPIQLQ
jgi:ComEC/Rec2-related protein